MSDKTLVNPNVTNLINNYLFLSDEDKAKFTHAVLNPSGVEKNSKDPSRTRFLPHNAAFAFQPQPPIDWTIDQLISDGSLNIIVGEPGCGKTYLMLSAGVCVALGKPWLGQTTKQQRVLFIDEESGERRFSRRLGEVIRGECGDETTPFDFTSLAQFQADHPDDVTQLEELIQSNNYGLVIIDALADIMTGDENSKQDTQPVFNVLRRLAINTNTAIILIHHTNKMGGYRGSSAIKGGVDLMLLVKADRQQKLVVLDAEKSRDCESIKLTAELKWDQDAFSAIQREGLPASNQLSKAGKAVLDFLFTHGPTSVPEIQREVKEFTESVVKKAIYELAPKGLIRRTNLEEGGQGAVAIYEYTPGNTELVNG